MSKKDFVLVFVISFLIRSVLFLAISASPEKFYSDTDSQDYEGIALNLMEYGVFSEETSPPFTPDLYRTPVYPVLIAVIYLLTGKSISAVIFFQIILGSLLSAIMVPLVGRVGCSPQSGRMAGLVLAVEPLLVLTEYQLITETVFIFLLLLAFWTLAIFFDKGDRCWLAGAAVLIGLASLTRPINQFLPILLTPLFLIKAGKLRFDPAWKNALIFLIVSMVITYSWALRNYLQTDVWTLSAIGDFNLLYYRAAGVIAEEEGVTVDEAQARLRQQMADEVEDGHLDRAREIELMREKALRIFFDYPLATLAVHAKGAVKVFANPGFNLFCIMLETQDIETDAHGNMVGCKFKGGSVLFNQVFGALSNMNLAEKTAATLEMLILTGIYLGAVNGIWKLFKAKRWFLLYFLLIPVVYFVLLSAGGESVSRFRIPFLPFLVVLMGIAFSNVDPALTEKALDG